MNILKDIPELVKADIISEETAEKILGYYQGKSGQSTNRLFIVFGVLGAILVGLGVILIIAHNWDEISRTTKTLLAFIPLLAGQILCGFTIIKRPDSEAWRESGAAFLFFAIGASISLVGQIHNIPGNLSSFLLVWMLLCLPLVYVMKSSITSLLFLIGITYYAVETSYWTYDSSDSHFYWFLLLTILTHYYLLYKKNPHSNFMIFHNWLIPISVIITLGTISKSSDELMFVAYFSLFGFFHLLGELDFFTRQRPRNNGYNVLGFLGTIVLLLTLSFDWFWEELRRTDLIFNEIITAPEFYTSIIISILASGMLTLHLKNKLMKDLKPIAPVFVLFILTFIIGLTSSLSVILINILVFTIGIFTIRDGAKQDNLGVLNYGLLIITALVICRFFDTDLSFVIRGGLFVTVGIGFFATNFWMLKKRKIND
jgi:uncharacterized membrane protein